MSSFPEKFSKVDQLTIGDHRFINESDFCFYLGEYTARAGYGHSDTNQAVYNFKKPMNKKGQVGWHYKGKAIQAAAIALKHGFKKTDFSDFTLTWIPPSKVRSDPLYDDRMEQVLRQFDNRSDQQLDIQELVIQINSTDAAHDTDCMRNSEKYQENYTISKSTSPKSNIMIFDDVLTTGAHFRAMSNVVNQAFPECKIVGVFLVRSVYLSEAIIGF